MRGRKTSLDSLAADRIDLPLRTFVPLAVGMGGVYGFFMGWFALINRDPVDYMQLVASTLKLPALFLLTLLVTFPSLYVFNALVGCRLSLMETQRLLVGAVVVNVTVAASLGPILGFFTLSTTSYSFMVLLNVALLAIGGAVGLTFLLHTLRRLAIATDASAAPAGPPAHPQSGSGADLPNATASQPGPLDAVPVRALEPSLGRADTVFRIWVLLYSLVGAQMGWLLRPFIGSPDLPFTWFRARQGNFFQAVFQQLQNVFGGT